MKDFSKLYAMERKNRRRGQSWIVLLNRDKNIRISRFISTDFLPTIEKFKLARELFKKYSIETDAIIYRYSRSFFVVERNEKFIEKMILE